MGIAIGIIIGIISGTVALILIKTANVSEKNAATILTLTTEILAIPVFWFGGPWVTTKLIKHISWDTIINPYIQSLAFSFTLIVIYPIFRWIVQLGRDLGQESG